MAQALLVFLTLELRGLAGAGARRSGGRRGGRRVAPTAARSLQGLQLLVWNERDSTQWRGDATEVLRQRRELVRIERRDASFAVADAVQGPAAAGLFEPMPRAAQSLEAETACSDARREGAPAFSRSYFVPRAAGLGWR